MSFLSHSAVLPKGFKACGIPAKIKKNGKKDLALFYSQTPCTTSALFTANRIQAAPIKVSRMHLKSGSIQAVVVNSGNANCMTGMRGIEDALAMAELVAAGLSLEPQQVLVSSTGIIGKLLPIQKIRQAIGPLISGLSRQGLSNAASAILTTDTFSKIAFKKIKIAGRDVIVSGITKGAGMIAPTMKSATMLAYIFTDASILKPALDRALREAVEVSFNAITIDGCMSTNDTVVVMANGEAGNKRIGINSTEERVFCKALKEVCLELARMIVRDAEGATKFIEINVRGAVNDEEANNLAFSVANSNLFKCAMFGSDPNWGRIAAALGAVPSHLEWEKLDISLNKMPVFKKGKPVAVKNNKFLSARTVTVDIDLHQGRSQKCVYTSDLSFGYVRINADYN